MTQAENFSALVRYREVVKNLAGADLKLRYRRSFLGYLWSLLYPLLTMTILAVVFSKMMRFESTQDFLLYVFAGLLPWNFLVNGFWGAGTSLLNNEALLKKIYLPKVIFPVSVTLARLVDFLINLVALFIIVSLISYRPSWALLALPLAILIMLAFVTGVTLALSAVTVYIRDATHLVSVLIQLGFFLTPIMYPLEMVPDKYRFMIELNPMTHVVRLFQTIIWSGDFPNGTQWAISGTLALASIVLGQVIFARLARNLIFRL